MKKILIVFSLTLVVAFALNMMPQGLDGMIFSLVPAVFIFFLLPFIGGILLILVQDKERSYEFLPVLLLGTLSNNIAVVLVAYLIEILVDGNIYTPSITIYTLLGIFLPFVALSLFGGLIGLVIRGSRLLLTKNKNHETI